MNDHQPREGVMELSRAKLANRRIPPAPPVGGDADDDNILLRPVHEGQGGRGPLVGHLVTAKEVWNLLPGRCDAAADALLTVLTVQRWLTDPRDQRLAPDVRRTEARRLAFGLAQRRCTASGF